MIEAMACGTPVIAFNRGSVPEVIEDGVTGFIVEDDNGAIGAVDRLGALSRARVRQRFEERFTARRMAQDYLAVYRSLADSRAASAPGRRRRAGLVVVARAQRSPRPATRGNATAGCRAAAVGRCRSRPGFRHQQPDRRQADQRDRGQASEGGRAAEMVADIAGERRCSATRRCRSKVPTIPWPRLKWPVPRVRSAMTSGTITPNTAAVTPSSSCTTTSKSGLVTVANSRPRIGSAAKPTSSSGRRPQSCARVPTQGESSGDQKLRHDDAGCDQERRPLARAHGERRCPSAAAWRRWRDETAGGSRRRSAAAGCASARRAWSAAFGASARRRAVGALRIDLARGYDAQRQQSRHRAAAR